MWALDSTFQGMLFGLIHSLKMNNTADWLAEKYKDFLSERTENQLKHWLISIKRWACREFYVYCLVICLLYIQGAAEKSGPLNFFAVFSATVWDFNTKFYSFIYRNLLHLTAK